MEIDYSEIESIEFIGERETIDICVEDTHCFFANGIYTHNSGFNSELNDVTTIGKAIEVFQKADLVITFSQTAVLKERMECIAYLLKNRLGKKEIALLVHYDPGKVLFIEKELINPLIFMSDEKKKVTNNTISTTRERLRVGDFNKK